MKILCGKFIAQCGRKVFFLCVCVYVFICSTTVQASVELVSWWPGDGDAIDIQDSNSGILYNGVSFATGISGQAFSLDGVDDHIRVSDSPNLDFTHSLSIESWIYPTGFTTSYPTIVGKWDAIAVNQRSYILHLDSTGRVYFRVSPNGYELGFGVGTVISNAHVQLNQWTHLAGVYDGTSMKIYINGALDSQIAYDQGIVPGSNDLSIGAIVGGVAAGQSAAPFAGLIDEVKIYGCATQCEKIAISVDIKPGSEINTINLCSNGAVPVAILGSETFDVYEIDTETLRFAEAAVKVVGKKDPQTLCSIKDVNNDQIDDLLCHYLTTNIAALNGESTSANVNGELLNGMGFEGTDNVTIVMDTCF